jgi:putative transposase
MPRSTFYRRSKPKQRNVQQRKASKHRRLSDEERTAVRAVLNGERFVDKAPAQIFAALLDDGVYLCSISTMYRILHEHDEVRERRKQARHQKYAAPELIATAPNQVYSWDITKLKGPEKWTYYYLYVIIDIHSRYVVGWMVASRESGELAKDLIRQTCQRQNVDTSQLIIHSDRGAPMTSKVVAHLLSDLGVTKSLNRPYVSNDNPFSESHFKTLKYQPSFPAQFGCIQDARLFLQGFFDWYNNHHYHSGLELMTPSVVHHGQATSCNELRQKVLLEACDKNPERFVRGRARQLKLPTAVWINKPKTPAEAPLAIAASPAELAQNSRK